MSNEVTKAPIPFGGSIQAIVPQDMDQIWRMANIIAQSGMAPKAFGGSPSESANKITVAIMHGMEVGLPPMAALQSIAVINGMPSLWGDGALAVIQNSGLLEDMEETLEGEGDAQTAICTMTRAGRKTAIVRRFSVEDAKKAGLWGKQGPWQNYPKRMLQMRARSQAMRDGFTECLKGLRIGEEAQDIPVGPDHARDITPRPTREESAKPAPGPVQEEAEEPIDGEVIPDYEFIDRYGEHRETMHIALDYVVAVVAEAEHITVPAAMAGLFEYNEDALFRAYPELTEDEDKQYYAPLVAAYEKAVKDAEALKTESA